MNPTNARWYGLALLGALACGQPSKEEAAPTTTSSAPAASVAEAPAAPAKQDADEEDDAPKEPFKDGAKAFAQVRETLLANYFAEGLTEDDLYRAATLGMLEHADAKMQKWNKLMSAREMGEIKNDLAGELVGVGVQIKFESSTGHADVLGTIPGSASERAGLLAGDKIVAVNGKLYKGMSIRDVVSDIRGKAGESVTMTVLRGDKLVPFTVTREKIAYDQPSGATLPGNVGYVRIPSFNKKTPTAVRASLEGLGKSVTGLVVDLRQNPGGSFDDALATAELLLPEGTGIVNLKRKGKPEEKHVAKGKPFFVDVPLTVLVDGGTASGAELLTAALQEGRHARVVGQKTVGKWSVQTIDELSNGYAFKYTVSLLKSPSGRSFEGVGLPPDVEVVMDEKALPKLNTTPAAQRVERDVQLRTALVLLGARR